MNKVLFLNLTAFSMTGGIERFNKCFLKALSVLDKDKKTYSVSMSAHDTDIIEKYTDVDKYKSFNGKKASFTFKSVLAARNFDCIVLGHINLALIGLAIKKLFPTKRLILITHGIDVWGSISSPKKKILEKADLILSVSNYTKQQIVESHKISAEKIRVFPNTIDPYFPIPDTYNSDGKLRERYGLKKIDYVLYTLSRLKSTELYKGYDKVIKALSIVINTHPNVKYVIAGKYDEKEKERILQVAKEHNVLENVILTGFLNEDELVAHYQMADTYIMPSKKEGFGIVFIEALVCGTPVIAGNIDGSVDALQNGEAGTLINPDSVEDIANAIMKHAVMTSSEKEEERRAIVKKTLEHFSFDKYKQRLEGILAES